MSGKMNRYFCQFLELLDQPESSYICCATPEIITLDGIVLSIESSRIKKQNLENPSICSEGKSRHSYSYVLFLLGLRQDQIGLLLN
jgi:hypothetical protein